MSERDDRSRSRSRSRSPQPSQSVYTRVSGVRRLSASSTDSDSRPVSPQDSLRCMKTFSSTSTLDSIACDSAPALPSVIRMRECVLHKRPPNSVGPGWGFVLRGTTSELAEGTKIYTCHIESIHDNGTAKATGLKEGDQIVSIDGLQVKELEHPDVVKMFQTRDKVSLVILPARYKTCNHTRVTKFNSSALCYLWALMRCLHTLEIININLGEKRVVELRELNFSGLISLRTLSINHCSLVSLDSLKGFNRLQRLESLSLAHNFLTYEVLGEHSAISSLTLLRRLDLARNLLNQIPAAAMNMPNLEVLVLVDNNISELPMALAKLTKLHTLCLNGNLLREVDKTLSLLPWLQKLTLADNALECEAQAIKLKEFLIASVEGNPYTTPDETGMVTRKDPSLRRTVSVRGQLFYSKPHHRFSLEWDGRDVTQVKLNEYIATQ